MFKPNRYCILGAILIFTALLSVRAWPEDGAASGPEDGKPVAHLGKWWERSPYGYAPIHREWLTHLEGTLSYQKYDGGSEGCLFQAGAGFVLRKSRWTNFLTYHHEEHDIDYGGYRGSVDTERYILSESIRFDFNEWCYSMMGAVKQKDDNFHIDDRIIMYGGFGVNFEPSKAHILHAFAAYGLQDAELEYPDPGMPGETVTEEETNGGGYFEAGWVWNVTPQICFSAKGSYLDFDEDLDTQKYENLSWNMKMGFEIHVSKHVSVELGYEVRYEENRAIEISDTKRRQAIQAVGVKIGF